MKTISLLRHGESPQTPFNDASRKLNKKGIECIRLLSQTLVDKNYLFDHVICSPAQRTIETMNILLSNYANNIETKFLDKLYSYKGNDLEQFIAEIDNLFSDVLIIGHNPLISRIANNIDQNQNNFTLSPGMFLRFEIDINRWSEYKPNTGNIVSPIFSEE